MDIESQQTLKYGQIIRIHGNFNDQNKGLLLSKGFTDSNTYYMTYDSFQQINNYRECLFQILPRGTFDIHDEYIKSSQVQKELLAPRMRTEGDQYELIMKNRFNEEIIFGAEVIFKHIDSGQYLLGSYQCSEFSTDAFKVQLVELLSSSTVFQLLPYQTFQQEGHPIYISEPVIIQHSKSRCKLDFIKDRRVLIDLRIDYTIGNSDIEADIVSYDKFRPCIRKPGQNCMRYEAVVNHNCNTNWIFMIHENHDDTKDRFIRIAPYDLIMFQYTQNKSILSVESSTSKVILKEPKNSDHQVSLEAVWEIQPIDSLSSETQLRNLESFPRQRTTTVQQGAEGHKFGRNSLHHHFQSKIVIFLIMFLVPEKSKSSTKYILRHYLSGKVLTVNQIKGRTQVTGQVKVNDFEIGQKDQYFDIQMAKKGFEELIQNAFVKICNNGEQLQMKNMQAEKNSNNTVLRRNSSFSEMGMFFKSLNEEDLEYKKNQVQFVNQESLHAFQMIKVPDELKKDLLFIVSSQEILLQFADILKLPVIEIESTLNDKILATVQDVLRSLLAYVMDLKVKNDAEKLDVIPLKKRQIYMKDLQMIEIVMEMIFFISYKNGIETLFKRWKSEREKLKNIYKLSYKLIEKMTKRNPQIKLHVSQWLELFLHQAMNIDDPQVQNSLSELLDDNYQAITKFITKTSLRRLVDILKVRVPHEKYLRILSSICVCNGKSIINNQIHTLNMFYQQIQPGIYYINNFIQKEFKFQFKKEESFVSILCHIGKKDLKWRTLKQFCDDSELQDDFQSWSYFISYFNLLADVCMNRNKFAKKYVEENFSLDILCSVLEDPDCLETNAIEPFLKLIHFAYVDCQHYTPIRRIARVREWEIIETKNDILRTHAEASLKPENCHLKRVMEFVENFLENFEFFQVQARNYNQNLYTILQVLKTTIRLGFMKSVSNLQQLLPNLMKVCSCSRDFQNYNNQGSDDNEKYQNQQQNNDPKSHYEVCKVNLTRMNVENIIVMKCKLLACEILDIIFDMETNVRVSKATQILKKMIFESEQKEKQIQPNEVKMSTSLKRLNSREVEQRDETPMSQSKKLGHNLKVLQEKQLSKKKGSFLFNLLDTPHKENHPPPTFALDAQPAINQLKNMDVFKKMGNMFRKNQESQKEQQLYDMDIWIEQFRTLIDERSLFVKVPKDRYNMEVLFAELSLFDNPEIIQYGLQLLNRIYGQRRELLYNFEKIIIVFQGFTFTLSVESRITRTKLQSLDDRNILSATLDNQKDFNVYIWRESENMKEAGVIQDLNYLMCCLKRGEVKKQLIKIEYDELYPANGLRCIYTEREIPHKLHQSLLKWQDLHESIFHFLLIALDIDKDNLLLMKALHISYDYLTMLVWNHVDNKLDFFRSFNLSKLYVHTQYNIGCIDFFKELYSNNKVLLYSERFVIDIATAVVRYCNAIGIDQYYKSKLFDFFRVMLIFNDKPIKQNQIIIMSRLQQPENKNIMFMMKSDSSHFDTHMDQEPEQLQSSNRLKQRHKKHDRPRLQGNLWDEEVFLFWIEEYQVEYEKCFSSKSLNLSPELTYMATYFQIFSQLIEDKNDINMGKCMNMHPYHKLLKILQVSQSCWPLKRHLRAYINRLYYLQDDYEEMSQLIIEYDFDNIITDLQDLIDLKIQKDILQVQTIKLKDPVRYSYLSSYIYLSLEETLISLNAFLNHQKFLDDLEDHLHLNITQQKFKTHLQLLQIGTQLAQIKQLWNHCKFICQFTKILIQIFKNIFRLFDLSMLLIRDTLFLGALEMQAVTEIIEIEKVVIDNGGPEQKSFYTFQEQTSDPAVILNTNTKSLVESCPKWDNKCSIQEFLNDHENVEELKKILVDKIFTDAEQYLKTLQLNSISKEEKVQQSLKRMFNIKNSEESKEDINESLNKKHRKLINTMSLSQRFQRFEDDEFMSVCEKMNQIDIESQRIYGTNFKVITLAEYIKNIIQLIMNNPHSLKDDLRIFFLKLLAHIITEKNKNNKLTPQSIDYWTPEYWSESKLEIEQAQTFLDDCGAAELFCSLLKEPNLESRISLTNELLIFGVAFLLGGNSQCQKSILKRMQADQSNTMLTNYTILIKKIGKVIYNNFKIRKAKVSNSHQFQVILTDNYDYYDERLDMMQRYHQIEPDDAKETAFKKQCLDIMCRSFRVLQLLCENNNVEMKNFIRQQTDKDSLVKLNTINFIEFTTSQLRIFCKIMNKYITCISNFMLDFLIEVTQLPCLENQLTLCKTTFFEDSCYMSQYFSSKLNQQTRLFEEPEDITNLQELYNKIIMAAMSVLEGNDVKIYDEIQNKLEPKFLIEIIHENLEALNVVNVRDMKKLLDLQEETFSEEIIKILNVLVIKRKIMMSVEQSKWVADLQQKIDSDSNIKAILQILETKIRNIEIVYQETKQMIFFPSHPLFDFLSEQTKDKIMYSINRETQREKILGLLNNQEMIFNEIEYNHKLNQMAIPITHKTIQYLRTTSATLSILVNLFMVLLYNVLVKNKTASFIAEFYEDYNLFRIILTMLSLLQFTSSTALFIVYLMNCAPLALKGKKGKENRHDTDETQPEESTEQVDQQNTKTDKGEQNDKVQGVNIQIRETIQRIRLQLKREGLSTKLIAQEVKIILPLLLRLQKKIIGWIKDGYYLATNEEDFIQFFLYWLFSFLGTFVKNYFFSLHLFDLFSRLSLLKNVFQAISHNAKQLLMVAMLGVLFIFVFSITSFDTYVDDIYQEDDPQETCTTLIQCMITLTTSGIIGTSMSKWDPLKFFLDTLYFVFFGLLFTNIISGIMIDTFAELRDQRQKIEDDKKNNCFICGIERQTLEKQYEEFEEHIKDKHYLWNYIFYIYGLLKKDSTEYTGLEYAIRDMLKKEDISWFPMITTDNTSIIENFEQMQKKMDMMSQEMAERNFECIETVKALLLENHEDSKEKKKQ